MEEEFRKYVDNFDFSDVNIERKYYHSLRVKSLCQLIAKDIKLNEYDSSIAQVIGLLHDYGRFMQWTKYHTYNDFESIDHGDYAVSKLFDDGEISNFWKDKGSYSEIYDAIKYHNKFTLPENITDRSKLFCEIIRDADKLDILYLFASKSISFDSSGEISNNIMDAFNSESLVDVRNRKTPADYTVSILAFVYDLNFKFSFHYLKQYKIFEQIFENLEDKEKFRKYFEKINKYINRNLSENS